MKDIYTVILLVLAFAVTCRALRRWFIARRAERQLRDHMAARRGFRELRRGGWTREDLQ